MTNNEKKEKDVVDNFLREAQALCEKYNVRITGGGEGYIKFNPGVGQYFKNFKNLVINDWEASPCYRWQRSKLTLINDNEIKIEKQFDRDLEW